MTRAASVAAGAPAVVRARPLRDSEFARDVLLGLSQQPKSLPCRYFYDERGSGLFEQITRLDEYYPTRTEISLLRAHVAAIGAQTQQGTALIELGSGSSRKTEILLESIDALSAYVAIDVSADALEAARVRLSRRFAHLTFHSLLADFSGPLALPADVRKAPMLGFFPGSTDRKSTRLNSSH